MSEVITPEAVTPEQRQWANAILRLAGTPVTSQESESGKSKPTKIKNTYGKGLQGSVLKDGRPIPVAYTSALVKGAPMISREDWTKVMESRRPSKSQVEELIKNKTKVLQDLKSIKSKREEWSQLVENINAFDLLRKMIGNSASIDATSLGWGVIPRDQVLARRQTEFLKYQNLTQEIERLESESGQSLAALDSPEDNPEHLEIGQGLEELALLEKKYPSPRSESDEQKYTQEKAELLYGLQALVFKWNDRRTSAHLPSSADAVAMADMVQRLHLEMIESVVTKGGPMPLSFENQHLLSKEEKEQIQETWKKLVASETQPSGPGNRLVVKTPTVDGTLIKTTAEAKEFRIETLANLSRLMQSPNGRGLLDEINKGTNPVDFAPGESASCTGHTNDVFKKGVGASATVKMVKGAKDSDVALSTETGGSLFAARFIAMGHELVHALHNTQGKNKVNVPLGSLDKHWNNSEEYQTISKGKFSEQSLRAQYGLSAKRFGHISSVAGNPVFNAVEESLETLEKMSKRDPQEVNKKLLEKGFDPKQIPGKLKLEIVDSDLTGPIPPGWLMSQLTFEQVKEILTDPSLYARLNEFGWAPYGLNRKQIEAIYENKEHHERSPKGLRMRLLGGEAALSEFAAFETKTSIQLGAPKGTTWEDKLEALEAANEVIVGLSKTHEEFGVKRAASGKAKVQKRMAAIIKVYENFETRLVNHGGEAALGFFGDYNTHVAPRKKLAAGGTSLFSKVNDLDIASKQIPVDARGLPNDVLKAIGTGNTGSKLKAAAALWKSTREEIEQLGGEAALQPIQNYNWTFGRGLNVRTGGNIFVTLATLKEAKADLAKLKSETGHEALKSAISGTNIVSDVEAALKVAQESRKEFISLGYDPAFDAIKIISKSINIPLAADARDTPGRIVQMKAAMAAFEKYAQESSDLEIQSIGKKKATLKGKADLLAKAAKRKEITALATASQKEKREKIEERGEAMKAKFDPKKMEKAIQEAEVEKSDAKPVEEAYRAASDALARMPVTIPLLLPALNTLEKAASEYIKNNPDPWFPAPKRRRAFCDEALKLAQESKVMFEDVQNKVREAIAEAKNLQKTPESVTPDALHGLAGLINSDFVEEQGQAELLQILNELAVAVNQATLEWEVALQS